jgi:hypothetical protein
MYTREWLARGVLARICSKYVAVGGDEAYGVLFLRSDVYGGTT